MMMRKLVALVFTLVLSAGAIAQQTTGSISGTVTDSTGAVVPGATVTVKGEAGQEYTVVTNDSGDYTIPGVAAGTPMYTVTITAKGFKRHVVTNVKVDVATPVRVNAALEAGSVEETVTVASGGEVLQTETATVGTTITGRQILETPIQSRDALDLVTSLPGTTTTGVVRTSSVNGLPKSALTIQIDGVDVQDNFLKSSDGFFTFIRPRIDNIDEVTVSTATPGAQSSGDGAVAINFATRRGTDEYRGTAFWQHRDEGLNAANFQNNYQGLPKSKLRLNQFGWSYGGPLPFPKFGEGGKAFDSGKGKAHFFVNYERFHLNESSVARTRNVLTTDGQNGIFRYGTTGGSSVNLFNLAAAAGLPNTIDPTVESMLNTIRTATAIRGSFQALGTGGTWFRQPFSFTNPGTARRRFLTVHIDGNLGKNHQIDGVFNDQPFRSSSDFLNNVDPAFPDIVNAGTQNSDRRSLSIGLRSSFGSNLVNQFRYAQLAGWLGSSSRFDLVGGTDYWNQTQRGFNIVFGNTGTIATTASNLLTGLAIRNSYSSRQSPTRDFSDNVTWIKGNHTLMFGGQWKNIQTISDSVSPVASTVNLGAVATDTALLNAISATTMPGATATEVTNAQNLYGILTGRVSGFQSTVYLEGDGVYRLNGSRHFEIEEETNGLYAQDSWKLRSNFMLTYGVRWQPQLGAKMNSANYAVLTNPNMVYDVSGAGNLFSPGTLTGQSPTFRANGVGERAFKSDMNNFAPSVGIVWSPDFNGTLGRLVGREGKGVFRGGFARAFIREGTLIVENSVGLNPGGTFSNNRATNGNANTILTVGTLLRTPGNPNLTPPSFNSTPVFPRAVDPVNDAVFGFAPDFHSGYVDSWSFGYQRELNRDTVVEFRYVGNRGREMQNQYRIDEVNAIENGFGNEFALAQANLMANITAGRGANFRYFGAGTGTSPLPIILSYFSGNNVNPTLAASYASANFASSTYLNFLNQANPLIQPMINRLDNDFRQNTLTAGTFQGAKPLNFVHNCPSTFGFCYLFDNSERSWFDAGVIEVRRRLSDGLRFEASYQFGKSLTNAYASSGDTFFGVGAGDQSNVSSNSLRNRALDRTTSQIDLRHAFKFDATWDLPFGQGRKYMSNSGVADKVLGGWTFTPIVRWQSGSPILLENIQIVGMTAKEFQKSVGVYYNQVINGVTVPVSYLPTDIIVNTLRAWTLATPSATNSTGYPIVSGVSQAPTGRFIAPAGYGNCQSPSLGRCGYRKFVLYGPSFFKMDASIGKRFKVGEKRSVELRMTAFDVLNHTNWKLGGWTGNVVNITTATGITTTMPTNFGQMQTGWAYQDPNGSNDPGGRIIDFLLRINF